MIADNINLRNFINLYNQNTKTNFGTYSNVVLALLSARARNELNGLSLSFLIYTVV